MKKTFITSLTAIISFLFISQQLLAQRYDRYNPRTYNSAYDLNLTQDQLDKMDKLELELEKSLSPLFSELRINYLKLDELELQRNPDQTKIEKAWEEISAIEQEIDKKGIAHEEKIRGLLTEEQKAVFDSYYSYGMGTGRGYYGRGRGRGRGYGAGGYGRGLGRGYYNRGRSLGTQDRGYFGRGQAYDRGRGFTRGSYRYDSRVRYGRGPCGAGLGRYSRGWGRWR